MMGHNGPGRNRPSAAGLLACLVGGVMLAIQLGVLAAMAMGVRDNQGFIYAFFIPFCTYLIGLPVGFAAAMAGLARRDRPRSLAGLALTLAGPILFTITIVVSLTFR